VTQNAELPGDYAEAIRQEPVPETDTEDTPEGVYRRGAPLYRAAGWHGVMPLPPTQKAPPPGGFTGHDGAWPSDDQIAGWIKGKPAASNLMLRINYGLVGIDVDAYETKTGGRTLKEAESHWGPLPATYRSSARSEDPVSGIRVFRVPEGVLFHGVIKFPDLDIGDIDIVQPHHRFVVAWPSINPKNDQRYQWYALDGAVMPEGEVPRVEDLPELPPKWIEALSRDAVREETFDGSTPNRTRAQRERINEDLYQQLIGLQDKGMPDHVVAARLDRALAHLDGGTGSRYDTTRDHVAALMRLQAVGRVGVPAALGQLYRAYVLEVADTRPQVVAEAEFLRFTEGAAALIAATMPGHEQGPNAEPVNSGKFDDEFLLADQLDNLPTPEPLIESVLVRNTYGILRGRDRSFKSFVALDWSLCLATGTPWQGKAVERVKVLYVAGEGAHGIGERKRAWETANDLKVDPEWFVVRRAAVNLYRGGPEVGHLLDYVKRGEFGLVVFDTLRRISGGAEGNGSDMGVVVDAMDRVRQHTADGLVLAVAHTDKGDNDTRGFSGIEDDADIVWSAKRGDGTNEVILKCVKMKDGPDGHQFDLRLRPEGTSLVVESCDSLGALGVFSKDCDSDRLIMEAMHDLFATEGAMVNDLIEVTKMSRASVFRSRARLIKAQRLMATKTHRLFLCSIEGKETAQERR
jgi:hypothetical protein